MPEDTVPTSPMPTAASVSPVSPMPAPLPAPTTLPTEATAAVPSTLPSLPDLSAPVGLVPPAPVPTTPVAATVVPDNETVQRIRTLAAVGTALKEVSNGKTFESSIFTAKESLTKFIVSIDNMQLDAQSKQGMHDLAEVLLGMLEKQSQDRSQIAQQNF